MTTETSINESASTTGPSASTTEPSASTTGPSASTTGPSASTTELTEVNPIPASDDEAIAMNVKDMVGETIDNAVNSIIEEENSQTEQAQPNPIAALMQMPITDQNAALNGLIGFVGIAQRRGVYALDEAAKAFECIKMFHNPN